MEPIVFVATVQKVQTLVDCGIRVTLDLPETAIMQMAELVSCKQAGVALRFQAAPDIQVTTDGSKSWAVAERRKWQSQRPAKKG